MPVVSPPVTSPPPVADAKTKPDSVLTPSKSIFDFVSPFDAFEQPPKVAPSKVSPVATPQTHTPVPEAKPEAPSPSPVKSDVAKPTSSPAAAVPKQVQAVRAVSRTNSSSPVKKHPPPMWPVNEFSKNNEGKGWVVVCSADRSPLSLPPGGWTVDLSQPNVDALVNTPGAVRVTPITLLKAENSGFRRGRTVAHTSVWIAYALSRGRVRLIAKASGARTVLQLGSTEPIVDITAAADALATVSADGSVHAFSVPAYWDHDDPPCLLVLSLPASTDSPLGQVNQVEWVRREGVADSLAIGGTEGAVIVKIADWGADKPEVDARHLFSTHKVLKTSGSVVQFCLNATHQAIGLISSSGYLCLYSVASLNKVWHRQLPSTNTSLGLSSARFCEAHILVGRGNDTMFDLVQITTELAVITTIKLTAPNNAATFAHAEYDSATETLFIAPYDRSSIYALHYAFKGLPPLRNLAGPDAIPARAFDAVAEFPLEPITSMSVGNWDGETQVAFFTPSGISQAVFEQGVLPPRARSEKGRKKQEAVVQAAKVKSPVKRAPALPAEVAKEPKEATKAPKELPQPASTHDTAAISSSVSDALTAHLKTALPALIQQELKTLLPKIVQTEVRAAMGENVSGAIQQSLQKVGRDVESAIAPIVPRTLSTLVQPAIERAVHQSISQTVVPALNAATSRVYDQLTSNLEAEMVQIRKDVVSEQADALVSTNAMLRSMAANIEALQRQVSALQASKAAAPQALRSPIGPKPSQISRGPSVPPAMDANWGHATPENLEETFLTALGKHTVAATNELVQSYWHMTPQLFPFPPARSPLSPAVLLTLLHRLSLTLTTLPVNQLHPTAVWLRKVVEALNPQDPRDAAIQSYFPSVARDSIKAIGDKLATLPARDGNAQHLAIAMDQLKTKVG